MGELRAYLRSVGELARALATATDDPGWRDLAAELERFVDALRRLA